MAPVGRKPKPIPIRKLEGNPGKRAIKPTVEPPAMDSLKPPRGLPAAVRRIWREIIPDMVQLGIATKFDKNALADYCRCVARLEAAERDIDERGLLVPSVWKTVEVMTADGEMVKVAAFAKNPSLQAAKEYRQALQRWSAEFGLTASSRSRISVPEPKKKDDFEEFLGRGTGSK